MGYETHGNIAPFGDVLTCLECGAVVRSVRRTHHDAWHERIEAVLEALES